MPLFNGFLMRDSLTDDGVVPSPGYPYYSPDVIAHAAVADPQTFFSANYGADPSQPIELGSRLNPVYVRAKNLSDQPLSGYSISVYRANTTLFLRPTLWRNNPLSTTSGAISVPLPATVQPGAIGVGQDSFVLDAIASNLFCLIGIASPTPTPVFPADFASYSDYIAWVRTNQNVCGRNLNYVRNYPNRAYERVDAFSNPSTTDSVPTLFQVTLSGRPLPAGTTFGLQCPPLNVNTNWNVSSGPVQTASGMTPPNFNGTVTTWVTLPAGGTWPPGARVDTAVWVGLPADDPVAPLATDFAELGVVPEEIEGLPENGVLVRLGNCETLFVSQ